MKALIVDNSYLIFRSYFGYPRLNSGEKPSGSFFGFAKTLLSFRDLYNPDYYIFTADLPKPTWRHLEYKQYKAGRPDPDPEMIQQIPVIKNWLKQISTNNLEEEGLEADDMIHSSVIKLSQDPEVEEILIFSADKDLYQLLVFPQVKFVKKDNKGNYSLYSHVQFEQETELKPIQWLDYKALVGDSSDNLVGVKGIGPKTATKILHVFGDLYSLFAFHNLPFSNFKGELDQASRQSIESKSKELTKKQSELIQRIIENKDQVEVTYRLSSLRTSQSILTFETGISLQKSEDIFKEYDFKTLLKAIGVNTKEEIQSDSGDLFSF